MGVTNLLSAGVGGQYDDPLNNPPDQRNRLDRKDRLYRYNQVLQHDWLHSSHVLLWVVSVYAAWVVLGRVQ